MIRAHPAEQHFRGEIARLERQHQHDLNVIDRLVNENSELRKRPPGARQRSSTLHARERREA